MSLIKELVRKGLLGKKEASSLEYEIKSLGKKEEDVLLEKQLVSEPLLFELKSKELKIPLIGVVSANVGSKLLELIPEKSAEYYQMVPLSKKGSVLEVGMVYPENLKAQEALKFLARQGKFSYKIFLITPSDYKKIFKRYREMGKEVKKALEALAVETKQEKGVALERLEPAEWERLAEEKPISKIITVLLRNAVDRNASDIHIEPTSEKLRIRFRVLGNLYSSIFLPLSYLPALVARIKILSSLRIDEARVPQDGRFSSKIGERKIDFRVSTFPTVLGEKVAIRILDPQVGLKSFDDIGLRERSFKILKEGIDKPSGMILATGPTGCGKTTTLYAVLQTLDREKSNIVTLEDPVEYFIEGINQSQVRPKIGYTFADGLRYVLRQDPDVIMVGEMRDQESAKLAVHAALTGHLMLSTLHTLDAVSVIPRLINLGIEPYLIPVALNIALSQRLVRRLCDNCKKKVEATGGTKKLILKQIEGFPKTIKEEIKTTGPIFVWEIVGCKKCNNTGYSGRIGIFEVLKMTEQLADIVLEKPNESEIAKEAARQEMLTLRQDAMLKVLQGVTTIQEALRVAEGD